MVQSDPQQAPASVFIWCFSFTEQNDEDAAKAARMLICKTWKEQFSFQTGSLMSDQFRCILSRVVRETLRVD